MSQTAESRTTSEKLQGVVRHVRYVVESPLALGIAAVFGPLVAAWAFGSLTARWEIAGMGMIAMYAAEGALALHRPY